MIGKVATQISTKIEVENARVANLNNPELQKMLQKAQEEAPQREKEAAEAKEQERIRQARESTRARVLNVLGSNSIQSFGLRDSNSSLNGDKLNYFTPSFYSHSISYDEFGNTIFDNAYRWSGANGGGDMLNAAGKSQYLNTPVGEMQVFLDLDDDNDQYGVGSIEYMGQLINLDDNQDGFLDSSDEFFSKLKLKGYNSKGEEIILKFSDVYNSLDLTKFVNTQRDVEENIKKYGYNKGNLESGTSLFRPEESYKKLNDTQKDQIRKMFAENADESGWIDLTKTYKDEYRLERLTFEKLLKNLDFAYSKTDLNGGLKLERLRFSGYDGREDWKYVGKQESYLAGLQNRFNKMYNDYYNNEKAYKLAIRREFQAITGLKFSEANFREFYNGLNSSSTAMKYASALKSVDSVVAMRLDDNGMMTLKFDSGRTMRLSLDELYTSNGDFNDLTERSERASAFSEAVSFEEEDLNKLDFNKIGADINMNGSITSLAELGVELIRKLSFQNGRSAFILTTGDGKELVANALHKIQNVENMIRFSELEEKDKLRGSKFEMEM